MPKAYLDWSLPQFCCNCQRQMRQYRGKTANLPDTVSFGSNGMCSMCVWRKKSGSRMDRLVGERDNQIRFNKTEQLCTWCQHWKPFAEFRKHNTTESGYGYTCGFCEKAKQHHLSYQELIQLLTDQCYSCAICSISFSETRWCIDHDHECCSGAHSCGQCVRGLLCKLCNTVLGMSKDNVQTLKRAVLYLTNATEW